MLADRVRAPQIRVGIRTEEPPVAKSSKLPSPCIDVCKFRRGGHCIGCSMTKPQKKMFKALKKNELQEAFVTMLVHQQTSLGRYAHWREAYLKKLRKKGRTPPPPLDEMATAMHESDKKTFPSG